MGHGPASMGITGVAGNFISASLDKSGKNFMNMG